MFSIQGDSRMVYLRAVHSSECKQVANYLVLQKGSAQPRGDAKSNWALEKKEERERGEEGEGKEKREPP